MSKDEKVIPKVKRNEPCYCGSGKKFKKCCINKVTYAGLTCRKGYKKSKDYSKKVDDTEIGDQSDNK